MPDELPEKPVAENVQSRIAQAILDAAAHIPDTDEPKSRTPQERARKIVSASAAKAGLAAGTLAIPPGLAGMVTLIPELLAVWRIQTQMVADIAAAYGQKARLTREQMLYCLFKATAAQAVGTLVVIVGESVLVRRTTLRMLQNIAGKIGMRVTQRILGKGIARWLPLVGALGVGTYTYYETGQVGQTAIELFEKPIEVESSVEPASPPVRRRPRKGKPPRKKETAKVAEPAKRKRPRKKPSPGSGAGKP